MIEISMRYHLKLKYTKLLGGLVPIFYLNCEHILFVYILKQKQQQKFADFIKKSRGF